MGGYAWVTLATNNSYSLGALVLAHSLKKANTAHKLAVLITPAVSQSMREQLQTVFDHVKVVDVLDSKDEAHLALLKRPELGITFTKIHCWRLVEFEKCVFLDADTLVVRNCDELFEKEEFSAAPDVSWPDCFNSGVFVYKPSVDTFNKLLQFAVENRSFDGGDQGLLNQFFSGWATEDIKKHLPFVYNLTSVAAYSYIPAFKHYGSETRIVHFIGEEKPWLQELDSATKTVTPPSGSEHLAPLLQQWWDLFCEKVHPNLDKNLEISNDGMLHPPEEVRSNFLPIALSNEPQGALVAEPCTPYREKNDFRQHNLPYLPFNVEGPSGEFLNVEYLHVSSSPPHVETEENGEEQQWREEVPQEDRNEETLEEKKGDCDHELNQGEKQEVQREVQQQENQQQEKQQLEEQKQKEQSKEQEQEEQKQKEQSKEKEQEEQKQKEQSKEQEQEEPPLPKDPFDYHSFFPDETCINNYLEKNLETYQPFHDHNTSVNVLEPEVSPTLPRFLTIPQNDQRQSGNLEQQEERKEEEEKVEEMHKNELPNHPERESRVESSEVPIVEPEKRELSKSKSMSCFPWDILDSEISPPRPIWKSQPELNIDRKYSMPKLKPILPKQRSFSKSIPSVVSKVTVYTELIFSSEYKDPVDLPKDKTGFIESHIHKEAKLRRSKSDADIQDRFGPLPYAPYPEVAKPVPKPKKILPRHLLDEYFDLSRCKRQMGNKPKPKDDRRKDSIHTLPALKPIVPGKDKKSTLIKKRKSKELSPGDGGKEKMFKRESEYNKENQQPKIVQTNVDEILKRLREFSKNYQHFFGETNTLQSKQVICKNATVQTTGEEKGECGTSEEFVSRTVAGSRNSKETQTSKGVKEVEFRQFRDYIKDQKKTSQKGLLGLQDILSESKTEKEEKPKLGREEQPISRVTVIPNGTPTKAPTLQSPLEESSNSLESKHKENQRQSKTDFQTLPGLTTEKSDRELPNPQKTISAPSSAKGSNILSSAKQPPGNKSRPPEPVTTALNDRELEPAKPTGRKKNKKPNSKGLKSQNGHVTPQDNGCPREINIAPEKKILKPEEMLCVPDFETPRSSRVVPGIVKPAENFRTAAPQIKKADSGETPENGVENGHEAPPHGSPTVGCSEDLKHRSGIAGAIAQLNLEGGAQHSQASAAASTAQEEYLRRQNWETGKMDYMGKDSFDNIWSKICQTIEAKNLEEAAGSPQQLADKVLEAAPTESPVSLSAILQKCPEYIETLPGELAAGSVEDDEIIFSKQPENKQTNLTNIAEEEEAGAEGSVKLSDILGDTKAPKKPECKVPLTTADEWQAETKTQPPSDTTSENVQKQPEMQPQPADIIKQMQGEVKPKPEEKPECKTVAVIPQPSQAVAPQVSTPIPDGQKPPEVKSQSVAATAVTPQPSQQPEVKPQSVLASPVTPQPSPAGHEQPDVKPEPVAATPQFPTLFSDGQKQTEVKPQPAVAASVVPLPTSDVQKQPEVKPQPAVAASVVPLPTSDVQKQPEVKPQPAVAASVVPLPTSDVQKQPEVKPQPAVAASVVPLPTSDVQKQPEVKPQPVAATPEALTPIPDGQNQTEVKPQSDAVVPVPPQLTTEGQKQPEAKPQPSVTAPVVPTPPPALQKQPEVKPQPSVTPQTASADAIAQPKPEPAPLTPIDSQKQPEVQPQPTSQPSDGKLENKTATPQTQSTEETKPLIPECKTVAIPSAPIIYPGAPTGQQDKKPEEKPQVKLEPIPLPPPETTSQESVKPDSGKEEGIKEEGKSKKGVFSKLLEMVGVAPKEKNGSSDSSTSVFYDVEESTEVKETEKPAETDKQSQELEKPKQSPIPKPERSSSPKDTKSDSIQLAGTRKSPSPKLTIPPKLPETEVTTPTPPPHPDAPPRRNSALLKVDDTILETPPVAEVQGRVTTEIEDIIGKAKSEVESLLQQKEAGEGSEPVNTMKLLMGEEEAKKGGEEEVEELRVTTEEERMRHKGEVVTSKLSDQILKAIPPPRRKAISEASTSAIPKPEQKTPGAEGKQKPGKPSSIPVPPPRNKGKPSPPSPPKTKGKK